MGKERSKVKIINRLKEQLVKFKGNPEKTKRIQGKLFLYDIFYIMINP